MIIILELSVRISIFIKFRFVLFMIIGGYPREILRGGQVFKYLFAAQILGAVLMLPLSSMSALPPPASETP